MKAPIITSDESKTLFSSTYNQYFHDIRTGAFTESLYKHVLPAFDFHKGKKNLKILDICFGLGYNTFSTIYYVLKNRIDIKLKIYSPELDLKLITSLKQFSFPKEFEFIKPIIDAVANNQHYEDEHISIEIFIGDARAYIQTLNNIDIVYQDAFSSEVNRELWTYEYFKQIHSICSKDVIITTYSVATCVRLSMYEAGFEIYEIQGVKRKQTISFKGCQDIDAKYIDMKLKQKRNPNAVAIYDNTE